MDQQFPQLRHKKDARMISDLFLYDDPFNNLNQYPAAIDLFTFIHFDFIHLSI